MNLKQIIAVALIVGGIFALVYGGFSYAEEKHDIGIGPVELQVTEKEHVDLPNWVGIVAIGLGVGMLLMPGRKLS